MQICLYVCKHYVYEQFSNIYVCTFDYIILCIYLFYLNKIILQILFNFSKTFEI